MDCLKLLVQTCLDALGLLGLFNMHGCNLRFLSALQFHLTLLHNQVVLE